MDIKNLLPPVVVGLCCFLAPLAAVSDNYELVPQVDGSSSELDIVVDISGSNGGSGTDMQSVWQKELKQANSDYLRIHFSAFSDVADHFEIRIVDRAGVTVQKIESNQLINKSSLWSNLINGSIALVEVLAPATSSIKFKIDRIVFQKPGARVLSISIPDDRQHVADYEGDQIINRVQDAIAKLSFVKNGAPYVCTGFLISPDLLLTNHHCIPEQIICDSAVAIFGYQYDSQGKLDKGDQVTCARVLKADYDLDFALLRLSRTVDDREILDWSDQTLKNDDSIYIIEHPAGQPKQISLKGCEVGKAIEPGRHATSDFSHYCDTLGGSSGSPVLNLKGNVVGLHHYGFGSGLYWNVNRAVRGELVKSAITGIQ